MQAKPSLRPCGALVAAVLCASVAGAAFAAEPQPAAAAEPKSAATITMAQARALALKVYPGKIMKAELETEAGGLRYSFDIRRGKTWREVGIDAKTGHIVEDKAEAPYPND